MSSHVALTRDPTVAHAKSPSPLIRPSGQLDQNTFAQHRRGSPTAATTSDHSAALSEHPSAREALSSPGQPLSPTQRNLVSGYNFDFSGVRVHADSAATELPKHIGARAFTIGNHIVFGPGQARDESLLRHELAHVVQQTGPVSGSHSSYGEAETEADNASLTRQGFPVRERRPVSVACAPDPSPTQAPAPKNMLPQHRYTQGENADGTTYKTAEGELGVPGQVVNNRSSYEQSKISQGTGDDAGHLIADLFGGAGGPENLSLQNWKANEYGTFKKLENDFARKLKSGTKIRVKVTDNTRLGEDRPFYRHVEWTETSPSGVVSEHSLDFANMHTPESRLAQNIPATASGAANDDITHVNFKTRKKAVTPDEIDAANRALDPKPKPRRNAGKLPNSKGKAVKRGSKGTTQAAAPHVTDTAAPHVTDTAAPHVTDITVPHVTDTAAPHVTDITVPHVTDTAAPHVTDTAAPHVTDTAAPHIQGTAAPHISNTGAPHVPTPEPEIGGSRLGGAVATGVGVLVMLGSLLPDYALEESTTKHFNEAMAASEWQKRLQSLQPEIDKALGDRYISIRYQIKYTGMTSPKPQTYGPSMSVRQVQILDIYLSRSDESKTGDLNPPEKPDDAKPVIGGGYHWPATVFGTVSQQVETGGQLRARLVREKEGREYWQKYLQEHPPLY